MRTLWIAIASRVMGALALAACGATAPAPTAPAPATSPQSGSANVPPFEAPRLTAEVTDAAVAVDAAPESAAPTLAPAEAPEPDASAPAIASACNEQPPQEFLVRGHFLKEHDGNVRAIQYRTDTYGYFKGYGRAAPDAKPPSASVVTTTFMGLPIRMHRKVVPALACVEQEIRASCADHPYTAHALAGIRFKNTYRGGEVTNHAYGIAIDVDPAINTCCGCVPPWNDAPACHRVAKTEYDRMAMPECWVHAFERYGFYWLGHDVLRDTMHFEFLGDPDRIVKTPSSPDAGAP
jgi:D-alanyl-D-alanine carboxypeptidase-like protein